MLWKQGSTTGETARVLKTEGQDAPPAVSVIIAKHKQTQSYSL